LASRLDGDRSQLEDEALRPVGGEADGELSFPLHLADVGGRSFDEEVTLGLLHNEEQLLEEINAALSRIDRGEYGLCAGCRHPIHKERLRVLPYARYCVACTKAREEE
jgi:RNA polymerase-binding transcription factor DksA